MSRAKDLLAGTGYWLGWKAICHLPESFVRWAFTTVTDIGWRRQGHGVQVLEGNLLRVLGPGVTGKELRAVSRAGMALLRPILDGGVPAARRQQGAHPARHAD